MNIIVFVRKMEIMTIIGDKEKEETLLLAEFQLRLNQREAELAELDR